MTGLGVDEILARGDASGVYYYLPDGLGSTVALTDGAGAIHTQYTYAPFGETTRTGLVGTNPFQFTGRENDNTGLYYYRARYYHPVLQRFISEDPIGFAGGDVNLYGYVRNNPVNIIDPTGKEPPRIRPLSDQEICANIEEVRKANPLKFAQKVQPGGAWDYKQWGDPGLFEDFGNYHYGVTGRALGFSTEELLLAAGAVHQLAYLRRLLEGQLPEEAREANKTLGKPWIGPPYGDDRIDQAWIQEGTHDYDSGYWKSRCHCGSR